MIHFTTRNQIFTKTLLTGICVLAVGLVPNWEHQIPQLNKLQVLGNNRGIASDLVAAPELAAIIEKPQITAKSALAYDYQSGSILFTYDFDDRVPIASLTKLMTAIVIVESGKMDEVLTVVENDTKVIGPNTGLVTGEKVKVSELIKAMLMASHNDATLTLARYIGGTTENFVKKMNQRAKELGMENTNFTNPVGFDDDNHYSSAQDLVLLIRKFYEYQVLAEIVKSKEAEVKTENLPYNHKILTTNKLLLEDDTVVGIKTGYTTNAKGNLAVRSIKDMADIVTIILGSDDREGDTRKILNWVRSVYRW